MTKIYLLRHSIADIYIPVETRFNNIESMLLNHDFKINKMFEVFNNYDKHNYLFLKHQEYDAYSKVLDIFKTAKKELIIIDNYVDKKLLDELRNINKNIIIISSNIDNTLKNRYLKQYSNITFINNDSYHDRFIIIDRKRVFHSV